MNRYLIILLSLVLASCGEDWAFKEETLYVASENKIWVTPDTYGSGFIMVDKKNISQGFVMSQNSTDLSPQTSYYFGIRTRISKYESFTQSWSSNFGQRLMIILTAGFQPYGDRLSISINETNFMYDFAFKTIGHIYFNSSSLSKTMTDIGYDDNATILSSVEILDSLTVKGIKYDQILHFNLKDFKDNWSDYTITDLYIAKHVGLIKYKMNNGITYER